MRSRENRLQEMRSVRILVLLIKMLHDFMSYKPLWNIDMPMEDRDQKIKFRKVSNTLQSQEWCWEHCNSAKSV